MAFLACAEETPPPRPAPEPEPAPYRIPSSAYVGEESGAWVWPGPDGSTDRCVEITRSWQWGNGTRPTDWHPPPIEPPEPGGLAVITRCDLYTRGRRAGMCTNRRVNVEPEWGAPAGVDAEEIVARYYLGRSAARAGRESCAGEWTN